MIVADQKALNSVISYGRLIRAPATSIVVLYDGWMGAPTEWLRGYKGSTSRRCSGTPFDLEMRAARVPPPVPVLLRPTKQCSSSSTSRDWNLAVRLCCRHTQTRSFMSRIRRSGKGGCSSRRARSDGVHEPAVPKSSRCRAPSAARFPLSLAPDLVETAGYFVGVRSGFCDVVSGTGESRKVVPSTREGRFYKGSFSTSTSASARWGWGGICVRLSSETRDNDHVLD